MPIVLEHNGKRLIRPKRHEAAWRREEPLSPEIAKNILVPYGGKMKSYPVSDYVNSAAADEPEMIEPLRGDVA